MSKSLRFGMYIYRLLLLTLLPIVLLYLLWRSQKDSDYRSAIAERFGFYPKTIQHCIWVHAVSLGELRSAAPIIEKFLSKGYKVVTTHFTPTGRRESAALFARAISRGQLLPIWVPLEFNNCYHRFFQKFKPRLGLVMEVELWPQMIISARAAKIPLLACNAQYPRRSLKKDQTSIVRRLRTKLVPLLAGVLAKSEQQAQIFKTLYAPKIAITGELRFEQQQKITQLTAADNFIDQYWQKQQVLTFASVVDGEQQAFVQIVNQLKKLANKNASALPKIIFVPRAPEQFNRMYHMLRQQYRELGIYRRSEIFDENLHISDAKKLRACDIIVGDSLGEMTFYLKLAHSVVVGGSFHPKGAHNIIEALALNKSVFLGPNIWTIEYPAFEAIASGVAQQFDKPKTLANALFDAQKTAADSEVQQRITDFVQQHSGATEKIYNTLKQWQMIE